MTPKIIAIVGPTASGKSALAVRLARKFNGEIISADSRQVYRDLDVGSGKLGVRERDGIKHHLLDVASPKRIFTAVRYKKLAEKAIKDVVRRGKLPIFCGGTGFYLDAVLGRVIILPVPPDHQLRARLERLGAEKLFEKLKILDPARAEKIDRHNRRRLIRAIEITTAPLKGSTLTEKGRTLFRNYSDVLKIGLKMPDDNLKTRIKKRLRRRLKRGLIAEVRRLRARGGLSWQRLDGFGLDYRYVSRYLRGLLTKQEMISQLETAIWHYAKRQMTWFKRDQNINWVIKPAGAERLIQKFLDHT
ncbi:MAG: tRNA (adenosine(37)-N6)-dimethylallyltransferase MiaA [Candidatus Vogelbacteria bacterium]|nr:tRNA (adenosine(37)-N6)-dimethylallyltransferase MiaA [Candidatus Vogelbacteria bacterium]